MFARVEPAEGNEPLDGSEENQLEDNQHCSEEHEDRVGRDGEYFLVKIVLEAIGIDQEVSAKESWHSQAEKQTFQVYDSFGEEDKTGEKSEPFEKFSVWEGASEAVISTRFACAESERVKSKVGEVECVQEDDDERNEVRDECETVVNCVPSNKQYFRDNLR